MTRHESIAVIVAAVGSLIAIECVSLAQSDPPAPSGRTDHILKTISEYAKWPRVSDRAQWAPTLCRMPTMTDALSSSSADEKTHGSKLYYLFASDAQAYESISEFIAGYDEGDRRSIVRDGVKLDPGVAPVGLTLVKQSWHAVPYDEKVDGPAVVEDANGTEHERAAKGKDGKLYKTGEQADLFVMTKMDPSTPDTDNGWVYAVISSDQKEVRSAGRIESCMKCHIQAPSDRLFGQPWARAEREHKAPKQEHKEDQMVAPR